MNRDPKKSGTVQGHLPIEEDSADNDPTGGENAGLPVTGDAGGRVDPEAQRRLDEAAAAELARLEHAELKP